MKLTCLTVDNCFKLIILVVSLSMVNSLGSKESDEMTGLTVEC